MADEFGVDLGKVFEVIDSSDLLIVRFHLIQDRLLVDFRTRPGTGPFIAVVPPVSSVEERMRSLRALRPGFPLPEQIMSFHWPRSVPVLLESGIWDRIATRMIALGGDAARPACEETRYTLRRKEQSEIFGAITGAEHYQTLWERSKA
jgi:hypothetical protein